MFFHIFKNRLKILLRKKSVIFWTMIFPIILATLFHLAFSDIQNDEKLKVIDVAVIKNEQYDNNQTLKTVLESVSKDDEYYPLAHHLIRFLSPFKELDGSFVPKRSLLREFIGNDN